MNILDKINRVGHLKIEHGRLVTMSIRVTVYIFPMIAYLFYQLYMLDVTLHSAIKLMQNMLTILCFLITYGIIYINYETVRMIKKNIFFQTKSIYAHFKFDYVRLSDKDELNIFEQYTKQTILNFYFIAIISPCIFNIFLYLSGTLDMVHLKLPFSVNNVSKSRSLYFSLLIYQTIAIYIFIIIGSVCYTSYLLFIQHACCQLNVLKLKIRQPFLKKKKYNQIVWLNKKEEEFNWIVDIIIRHKRVTKFVDYLNKFSEIDYLICTFAGMLIIMLDFVNVSNPYKISEKCRKIFQLATIMRHTSELIECGTYIVCSLFAIYINFYIGQMLINHSQAAFTEL
ncbi:hypothetical protein V1477_011529 [Vespula maculifrons]|uniref:Odorant receptor n=1 Tax=Vespula maculifrons TaxID=7453 RepID=A0ABD2BZG7_VESMC